MHLVRLMAVLCTLLVFGFACTTPAARVVESPMPVDGKAVAPVDVRAELLPKEARITVKLHEAATDVQVSISGIDGLGVSTPNSFAPTKLVNRGDSQTVVVALTPPPERSSLVVSISGIFHGAKLQRVATFAVGDGPVRRSAGEVITTGDGDKIKGRPAP